MDWSPMVGGPTSADDNSVPLLPLLNTRSPLQEIFVADDEQRKVADLVKSLTSLPSPQINAATAPGWTSMSEPCAMSPSPHQQKRQREVHPSDSPMGMPEILPTPMMASTSAETAPPQQQHAVIQPDTILVRNDNGAFLLAPHSRPTPPYMAATPPPYATGRSPSASATHAPPKYGGSPQQPPAYGTPFSNSPSLQQTAPMGCMDLGPSTVSPFLGPSAPPSSAGVTNQDPMVSLLSGTSPSTSWTAPPPYTATVLGMTPTRPSASPGPNANASGSGSPQGGGAEAPMASTTSNPRGSTPIVAPIPL